MRSSRLLRASEREREPQREREREKERCVGNGGDDGCGCAEEKLLSFDKKKRKKGGKRQTRFWSGGQKAKKAHFLYGMAHAFFIIIRESFVFKVVQKGIREIIKISLFC